MHRPATPSPPSQVPALPLPAAKPPERAKAAAAVAWLMDEVIPVPGTQVKVGLDPILGAFGVLGLPVGDAVTNGVSIVSLIEAVRRGLPFQAMTRIAGNILVNAGFGSFPILGNIFSVFFRSNSRNRDIINAYLRDALATGKPASWWRVVPVILFLVAVVIGALCVNMFLWAFAITWLLEKFGLDFPLPRLAF